MPLIAENFEMPADGWIMLAPFGQAPKMAPIGPQQQSQPILQIVDAAAAEAILANFRQVAGQPDFAGILLDFDHHSLDAANRDTAAAGWIMDLQIRNDGIYGQLRPTDIGAAAINGGRHRFISPVWLVSDMQHITGNQYRPLKLHNAALTNNPNFSAIKPIANAADQNPTAQESTKMDEIKTILGLAAEATEADIVAAIQAMQQQLAAQSEAVANSRAEADLAPYLPVVPEAMRPAVLAALKNDRAATLVVLDLIPKPAADPVVDPALATLPNSRAGAASAPTDPGAEYDAKPELQSEFRSKNDYVAFRKRHAK